MRGLSQTILQIEINLLEGIFMSDRKTHQQFIEELRQVHPHLSAIDTYVNNNTKLRFQCNLDRSVFKAIPRNIFHVQVPCPVCRKNLKMTTDKFRSALHKKNSNIELIGEYIGIHHKTQFKCLVDGYEWTAEPNTVLNAGRGCPKCGGTLRLTDDEFRERLATINPDVSILGRYERMATKVHCQCPHGHFWDAYPRNLLGGHDCPSCSAIEASRRMKLTQENFCEKVHIYHPHIEVMGEYQGSNSDIELRCMICGNIWTTKAHNSLNGHGCPKCGVGRQASHRTKSHNDFISELKELNDKICVLSLYQNHHTKISCQCLICGHIWKATPQNLLRGTGCPRCSQSRGEQQIEKFLLENSIEYYPQHRFDECRNKRILPFDFYCPAYNCCIEYDGQQHFYPVNFGGCSDSEALNSFLNTQINDQIKTQFCNEHHIDLLRIPYEHFKNIDSILTNKFCNKQL